jgi:hypothetical protein
MCSFSADEIVILSGGWVCVYGERCDTCSGRLFLPVLVDVFLPGFCAEHGLRPKVRRGAIPVPGIAS